MADISEININDIPYSIKDTQARSTINSVSTNLENYLPLSGGSLTGGLTTSLQTIVKDNTIDTTLSPESNLWPKHFVIKDKDNTDRGYFELYQRPDTTQGIQMETKRIVNGESLFNGIRLGIKEDGEKIVNISEGVNSAWRNALGASNGVWPISLGGTGNTTGNAPTATKLSDNTRFVVYLAQSYSSSGTTIQKGLYDLSANVNIPVWGTLEIDHGGTGATSVTSSDGAVHNFFPTNLGTTIEYLTGLTNSYAKTGYTKLPLAIALGGTGQTDIIATTGTRDSGATSGTIHIYKWGKFVNIIADPVIYLATAVGAGDSATIGTIPSSYRPKHTIRDVGGSYNNKGDITISTAGTISFVSNGTAKAAIHNIYFNITYVID